MVAADEPGVPVRRWALVFLAGTVLVLLGVVSWVAIDGDETAQQASIRDAAAEPTFQGNDSSAPDQPPTDTRTERCSDAAEALRAPLEAARPALEQWDVHVAAMNQLVAGEITLQQATEFWDQTRVGAQGNVARFRTAWTGLRRAGVDCPAPALIGSVPEEVRSCSRLVEAEVGVLRAAKTSIDTWETHVRHMEMLRMGTLSPEKATEMWLTMWKEGVRDLTAYRSAMGNPGLQEECPDPGSSP